MDAAWQALLAEVFIVHRFRNFLMMSATSRLQFLPAASCVSCWLQQTCAQKQGLQSGRSHWYSSTQGINRWRESVTRGARFSSGVAGVTCAAMKYNNLGWSDVRVSEACFGVMTFGNQTGEEQAHELLDYAQSRGVNFFDTAEMYSAPMSEETAGKSEEILGTWLKRQPRDKAIVATKIAGYTPSTWVPGNRKVPRDPTRQPARLDRDSIFAAIKGSLRRLQTDYVDLYQLHWPDRYAPIFGQTVYDPKQERPDAVPFEETVEALGVLIKEGKIRHWGLSNETTFGVCQMVAAADKLGVPRPVSIQNSFSLVHRSFETELAEACAPSHFNIGLLPWSPLAGGALTGKYLDGGKPAGARFTDFSDYMRRFQADPTMHAARQYAELAKSIGVSPTVLALAWCKSRWFVASTIFGATSMQQLQEDLDAFEVELSDEALQKIDAIHLQSKDPCMTL
ncbi:aldo keto reductase [Klebsormidium nitens]|uniref:Aldo keto reductase n=1 Tax=Klebsormidium nitens TaxID=105231 RepID=A0A1Y1HM18_KLENI|nr:aldo keto reductase [Klebsormidium nitens]|eukprot:GAQ78229.1 aldo keto reductase [Klebsormidium nitens]